MCTVQVLLFAEAMRRSDVRPVERPGARVCRRLFQNENGVEEPSSILRKMEQQLRKEETKRWNFDFEKEQPLPGRYQWVRVMNDRNVPSASTPSSVISPGISSEGSTSEVKTVSSSSSSSSIPATKKRNCAGAGTQPRITDFLRKKKRPLSEASLTPVKSKSPRLSSSSRSSTLTRMR